MIGGILFLLLTASASADLIEECMNYTIYPLQYELTIMPYIFTSGSAHYYCDITIDVIANAPGIQVIELDAANMDIREGSIQVLEGNTDIVNGARPFEHISKTGKLYIHLREPLKIYNSNTNAVYKIRMSFTKNLKTDSRGMFLVKYYDEDSPEGVKYLYTSRFAPNSAKYAFPCFENPRFESGFKFNVYVLPNRSDLQYTNTSLTISEFLKKDSLREYEVINYMRSPQVALHQVGFHLSQFAHNQLTSTHTNDTLYVWAPSKNLQNYNFILYYGVKIIDLLHEFSGIRRPLLNGPINIVGVPTNLMGYEVSSWNLLTNGANRLEYIGQRTSIKQLERMKFELAQQLSRLWLGNPGEIQVTRWREEWFKEGISTYMAYYLLAQYSYDSQTVGIKRPLGYYGLRMKHQAMAHDWHHSTPALTNFKNSLAVEIPSRYKELVTMKTGAIWWMLENWLQSDQLQLAFVKHVNRMRGQYISMWELIRAIDNDTIKCTYQYANGSTPTRILESWFQQSGYPVVTVNVLRDRTPNAIQLKQRHFSFNPRNRGPTDFLIPISYHLQSNENCLNCDQPRFIISQTYTFSENLNGGWIILNTNASGYYRVNYDTESWKLIAATLKKNPTLINEMNRAQIVNDVFALYMSGDVDRLLAEDILCYLDNERSLVVWEAAIDGFSMLRTEGSNTQVTKNLYWEWEEFMGERVMRIMNLLIKSTDESPQTRLLNSHIISFASEIGYEPCLKYLRNYIQQLRTGLQILNPDIREAAFYMSENGTSSHADSVIPILGDIEQEDKDAAKRKVREKNGFLISCSFGEPRPMPITATETPITPISVTEKLEKPIKASSSTRLVSSITSIIYLSLILFYQLAII